MRFNVLFKGKTASQDKGYIIRRRFINNISAFFKNHTRALRKHEDEVDEK